MSPSADRHPLSPLEHDVMAVIWRRGEATAEEVVAALASPLKNATVRTLLRRLEAKGLVRHTVRGRAYVYRPRMGESRAAAGVLKRVMQRFFAGSPSKLLVGLIDEGLVDPEELRAVPRAITKRAGEAEKKRD